MKTSKLWCLLAALVTTVIFLFPLTSVFAESSDVSPILTPAPDNPAHFQKFNLLNYLEKDALFYNSLDLYGGAGTRFGPPRNRSHGYPDAEKYNNVILDATDHQWLGTGIYPSDSASVWGYLKVSTTLALDESDDYLYAPTMLAANDSRLELVVFYHNNGSSTERKLKVWDHYQETFNFSTNIDSTFCDRYVRNSYISAAVLQEDTMWYAVIWDYTDSQWDTICSAYGNGTHLAGWVVWEEYGIANTYPDLPDIRAYDVKVKVSGNWVYVTYPSYGTEAWHLHDGFPYNYDWYDYYYDWHVGS